MTLRDRSVGPTFSVRRIASWWSANGGTRSKQSRLSGYRAPAPGTKRPTLHLVSNAETALHQKGASHLAYGPALIFQVHESQPVTSMQTARYMARVMLRRSMRTAGTR